MNDPQDDGYQHGTLRIKKEGRFIHVKLSEQTDMLLTKEQAERMAQLLLEHSGKITNE